MHAYSREFPMKMFTTRRSARSSDGYSVIDEHLTIAGDLATDGTVRIDGRIEGSLHRTDVMIIGDGACVVGDVEAREVVIGGELTGNLRVTGRVEVQKSGTVRGDIQAAAVMLAEGGKVHGHVIVHPLELDVVPLVVERRLALTPGHGVAAVGQS
jgi:cytoskeletal protein CcmA (bactofilin family)